VPGSNGPEYWKLYTQKKKELNSLFLLTEITMQV